MSVTLVAIAILITLFILWAAIQPKQGSKASNAPEDVPNHATEDDITHQLPKPKPQAPTKKSVPPRRRQEYIDPQDVSSSDVHTQIRALMANNQRIEALKLIRTTTGWGLKETKAYLDKFPNLGPLNRLTPATQTDQPSVQHFDAASSSDVHTQIRALMLNNQRIEALRLIRTTTGWGLKEAKAYLDKFPNLGPLNQPSPFSQTHQPSIALDRHNVDDRIRLLLQQHRNVEAIKVYRQVTSCDLRTAKDYVEDLAQKGQSAITPNEPITAELQQLLNERKYIDAIQRVQTRTGMAVSEAKDYLEENFDCKFPF